MSQVFETDGLSFLVRNRKAVMPSSPGLPLRLPWVGNGLSSNRNAVAALLTRRTNDATALRLNRAGVIVQGLRLKHRLAIHGINGRDVFVGGR